VCAFLQAAARKAEILIAEVRCTAHFVSTPATFADAERAALQTLQQRSALSQIRSEMVF
jgi:hypothetical protein